MADGANTDVEQTWNSCCDAGSCSDAVRQQGWQTLQELRRQKDSFTDGQADDFVNGQACAVLYLTGLGAGSLVSVSKIVHRMKLNMKDFFFHVEEVQSRLKPGQPLAELKQVKEQYVIFTVFFKKWRESFATLFPTGFVGSGMDEAEAKALSLEIGWYLFLLAKLHAKRGDIVNTYPLLVSVVHLLLAHLPAHAKTAGTFWQDLEAELPPETYPFPSKALAVLCSQHKLKAEDLHGKAAEMEAVEEMLSRVMPALTTPTSKYADGGGGGFKGLLQPATLRATRDALRKEYDGAWTPRSLDGRFFFTEQAPLRRVAPSVPASPMVQRGRAVGGQTSAPPMLTPQRQANPLCSRASTSASGVPQTPISSQLESNKWLKDTVTQLQPEPRPELLEFFGACHDNPAEPIKQQLQEHCQRVEEHLSKVMEISCDVEDLILLSRKLYYKMLLAFLQAEQQRLNVNDFSKLLSNRAFHCSLLACCMEAVFAANSVDEAAFPTVLDLLDLHAFDFAKVIESFVKTEPRLPHHLRAHFADVEAKILELLAWADGSPLHALMSEYDAASEATASPGPNRAKVALEQFIKKVWYLAAVRIQEICTRLLLPSFLVHQVWNCLKLVLKQCRHLLSGRHLDQIVMCTVYGVCKVNQRSVTFRHIIEQYKRQPKASPKVFREVRMVNKSDKPQDIICFYNQVYIPAMKEYLMEVVSKPTSGEGAAGSGDGPGGVMASPSLTRLTRGSASPQRVSTQRDVYVSQPRTPNSMTPRTKTLYAFGDTPAAKLQTINLQLNRTPGSDAGAMHVLHQMRSGTSPAPQPAAAGQSASEEEASEPGGRKRSLNLSQDPISNGGAGGRSMRRRLESLGGAAPERSDSQASGEASDMGDNSS